VSQDRTGRSEEDNLGRAPEGTRLPILISGCAFSGLEQSAAILSVAGITCGFEKLFGTNVKKQVGGMSASTCEASSLAVPHVPYLDRRIVLVHQVRHPLDNIASLVGSGFFAGAEGLPHESSPSGSDSTCRLDTVGGSGPKSEYLTFLEFHRPELVIADSLRAALRYWVLWNLELEFYGPSFANFTVLRVEDSLLPGLEGAVAVSGRSSSGLRATISEPTSPDPRGSAEIAVEDLPNSWELDLAIDLASRLGYSL